jgi:hypothetical protein
MDNAWGSIYKGINHERKNKNFENSKNIQKIKREQ